VGECRPAVRAWARERRRERCREAEAGSAGRREASAPAFPRGSSRVRPVATATGAVSTSR